MRHTGLVRELEMQLELRDREIARLEAELEEMRRLEKTDRSSEDRNRVYGSFGGPASSRREAPGPTTGPR